MKIESKKFDSMNETLFPSEVLMLARNSESSHWTSPKGFIVKYRHLFCSLCFPFYLESDQQEAEQEEGQFFKLISNRTKHIWAFLSGCLPGLQLLPVLPCHQFPLSSVKRKTVNCLLPQMETIGDTVRSCSNCCLKQIDFGQAFFF